MVVYAIPHILSFGTEGTDERNEKVVNHLAITKWLTKTKLLIRGKFKFFRRAWEKKPQSVFRLFFGTIVFSLFSIDSDHSFYSYPHSRRDQENGAKVYPISFDNFVMAYVSMDQSNL